MTYQSDFFYQNEKYFKVILLRYEKKTIPKRELINYLKNDCKDNESLFLYDFDYKDMGEIYGDEEKVIDYMNKKREREDYNDNNEEYFDNFSYEHEHKKYNSNNEYYNRIMFGNKNCNFDNEQEHENDNDNEDDIKKNGFLPNLRVNEKHEDNNDDDDKNFHF